MRNILLIIQILFIIVSCNPQDGSNRTIDLKIQEPILSELSASNSELSNAIEITKEHLSKLNAPIDSMYLIGVDSTNKQLWEIKVIHYKNFLIKAKHDGLDLFFVNRPSPVPR